jgi:hypothetical protein
VPGSRRLQSVGGHQDLPAGGQPLSTHGRLVTQRARSARDCRARG